MFSWKMKMACFSYFKCFNWRSGPVYIKQVSLGPFSSQRSPLPCKMAIMILRSERTRCELHPNIWMQIELGRPGGKQKKVYWLDIQATLQFDRLPALKDYDNDYNDSVKDLERPLEIWINFVDKNFSCIMKTLGWRSFLVDGPLLQSPTKDFWMNPSTLVHN